MKKTIVTLTGPSASGKSTLERLLCQGELSPFTNIISTTTRLPRAGEVEGRHYFFVQQEAFLRLEAMGQMVEKTLHSGNHYGATVAEFDRAFGSQKIPVIVVDPSGVQQIEKFADRHGWAVVSVFVDCPPELRFRRLVDRFVTDMCQDSSQKTVDAFVKRLVMTTEHESKWSQCAFNYTLNIRAFTADNQAAVCDTVASSVFKARIGASQGVWSVG